MKLEKTEIIILNKGIKGSKQNTLMTEEVFQISSFKRNQYIYICVCVCFLRIVWFLLTKNKSNGAEPLIDATAWVEVGNKVVCNDNKKGNKMYIIFFLIPIFMLPVNQTDIYIHFFQL